ncbi:hypothetical protein T265_05100 [Opisthorchis viverrini]|uniref:Uncharacterized protein n=1 Tax=Opisthorchis viverrini TaxID=6198 RepID=A0A075AFP2_OPIVI|nr:hypothetical protein T265_05100 [Opisthorchis viverrini]KER27979.1 hypothetical protein T265_05100 [Opisthorchis viverrini]
MGPPVQSSSLAVSQVDTPLRMTAIVGLLASGLLSVPIKLAFRVELRSGPAVTFLRVPSNTLILSDIQFLSGSGSVLWRNPRHRIVQQFEDSPETIYDSLPTEATLLRGAPPDGGICVISLPNFERVYNIGYTDYASLCQLMCQPILAPAPEDNSYCHQLPLVGAEFGPI